LTHFRTTSSSSSSILSSDSGLHDHAIDETSDSSVSTHGQVRHGQCHDDRTDSKMKLEHKTSLGMKLGTEMKHVLCSLNTKVIKVAIHRQETELRRWIG
jgi:hypothetical protein